jgi:hypothetical protein
MDAIEKRALDQLAQLLQSGGFEGELRVGREFGKALVAEIAALTPPEGYVLVPVEPTEAMQIAVEKANPWLIRYEAPEIWAAMLAARPEVP